MKETTSTNRDSLILIDKLRQQTILTKEEYCFLIKNRNEESAGYLFEQAREIRHRYYGHDVYIRGLIEFTNYCKRDCLYCGIRCGNRNADRYRLTQEEILSCCQKGYELGFRTFVLQGGEDPYYTADRMISIISAIKKDYADCALTLSVGELSFEEYQAYFKAGADRYLLRHETANDEHYRKLHPENMSPLNRKRCLSDLKRIGYQTGCGFMVGSPYQTTEHLAEDLLYLKELRPEMVGIGPFIAHHDTPFREMPSGTLELTLFMIGLTRLTLPDVLLPATTALGTIDPSGREKGILAGANVVMPNLSPMTVRDKYLLYDNKACTGDEAAECKNCMAMRMKSIGYKVVTDRGDHKKAAISSDSQSDLRAFPA